MNKAVTFAIVILLIIVGIYYFEQQKPQRYSGGDATIALTDPSDILREKAKKYERAKEIVRPHGFINVPSADSGKADSVTIEEFIGKKVILLDIWTYSCINCQRTLPYITAWDKKYRDDGLQIIGIHTPEFEFEKLIENVQTAVRKWGIEYPVVLDNEYGTWRAYKNQYWPRKYLIDIDGFVVYDHIGEGRYDETEAKIQELLQERKQRLRMDNEIASGIVRPDNVEEADTRPRSPEAYFGSARNQYLGNGKAFKEGAQSLDVPSSIEGNMLYLGGEWEMNDEYAQNKSAEARIIFKYRGEKVFLVADSDEAVTMRIVRDGQPIGDAAGSDVQNGTVEVQASQLYRIVEDPKGYGTHTLEIIIENPGVRAFAFTFG
jgi:thiol-disulfide isomerase/thioredoxin